ncbi:tetratricopeptide repeat protein [Bizionia argentinensis JUB59]|uniref:Tetratricopeptide repeat protein n=1 Tax=Bizionia argentinensis JUB59 TaxID=1046627 RepID=G2EBE7_9FLAO|nr:tetratricopeptide repeat protein [Bizionia argentinensis]EGV44282.2 tetratricopeptide repeat protein [Bizionia argentinensis JUB59]
MKTLNYYITLMVCVITLSSCENQTEKITKQSEYNTYLEIVENEALQKAEEDLLFWENKLEKEPSQYPYLAKIAASNSQLFTISGNISNLIVAETNLKALNERTHYNNTGYLRSLARNYISQHRFREAKDLLLKAKENGENIEATYKMLFDVELELGDVTAAKTYLENIKDLSSFDYLIRLSKWSDHQGNLDAAIKYMEKATAIAESSNINTYKEWAYTNLADFYGHAGKIEQSYNYYLKALALNPNDAYAKKGIAWIVYSYERNPEEAMRILNSLTQGYHVPDLYLLKAEIADFMQNKQLNINNIDTYLALVSDTNYGDMYNAYNIELFLDSTSQMNKALALANREIQNRPTAQSYDLLAWSYYKKGNVKKALSIMEEFVVGNTFEPLATYHLAIVYKANGLNDKANALKPELKSSIYELGPVLTQEINNI